MSCSHADLDNQEAAQSTYIVLLGQGLLQHEVLREAQLLHGSYQKALDRLLNQACMPVAVRARRTSVLSGMQHPI